MLGKLFNRGKAAMEDLKNGALKFKEENFLEASVAGGFMVANADGNIDSDEKSKLLKFIKSNEALSVYNPEDVVKQFKKYSDLYEFDVDAAEAAALQAISKIKSNTEKSKFLVRMICSIGKTDGDFDKDEKTVVRKICLELNLNPSEFDV